MIQKEERIGGGRDDVAYYPGETPEPLIPGCTFSRRARVYENHATHSIAGGVSIAAKLHGFRVLSTLKLFPANRKNSPSLLCTPPPFPVCHTVIVSTASTVVTMMDDTLFYGKFILPARCLSAVVAEEIGRKLCERFVPMAEKHFFKIVIK